MTNVLVKCFLVCTALVLLELALSSAPESAQDVEQKAVPSFEEYPVLIILPSDQPITSVEVSIGSGASRPYAPVGNGLWQGAAVVAPSKEQVVADVSFLVDDGVLATRLRTSKPAVVHERPRTAVVDCMDVGQAIFDTRQAIFDAKPEKQPGRPSATVVFDAGFFGQAQIKSIKLESRWFFGSGPQSSDLLPLGHGKYFCIVTVPNRHAGLSGWFRILLHSGEEVVVTTDHVNIARWHR